MSLSLSVCKAVLCFTLASALAGVANADSGYGPSGAQYVLTSSMPGDQVRPQAAVNSAGGFVVWDDNRTDGLGKGVSALQLDAGLSPILSSFRVNETAEGDQERPQVAVLRDGGAVFVWQGGAFGAQKIFARILANDARWTSGEFVVSQTSGENHIEPSVAVLANGNIVVVWSSVNALSLRSMKDVFGQILNPSGEKVGEPFRVNQFSDFNQRSPAVTALANGGFAISWVSEQQRILDTASPEPNAPVSGSAPPSVDVMCRAYSVNGVSVGGEFPVNTDNFACSNPSVTGVEGGGVMVVWSQKDIQVRSNGWDIYSRVVSLSGAGTPASRVNSFSYGDQFVPKVATVGEDHLVVWTSLAQDGSFEGVFGQYLKSGGEHSGGEFRVNTTTASKQIHPTVTSDGQGRFVALWSSFVGGVGSFDLFGQRYFNTETPLWQMAAPFVSVPFTLVNQVYRPEVQVSWPEQTGVPVKEYKVYVDGTEAATVSEANAWVMTPANGLKANETHTFQVAFVTTDGRISPTSPAASATTWGGFHWGGIPAEWMSGYYGNDFSAWPTAGTELAERGPTLLEVFRSGGSPLNPASWLRATMVPTEQGVYLEWNPQPGLIYQVQSSSDLNGWTDVGEKRFASGNKDSLFLGYGTSAYYRVVLMR